MGEVVGTAVVEIHARIDDLERDIRRGTTRAADKAGKDSGRIFGSSFKRNAAAFTGGLLGAGAIIGAIRGIRQLASESIKAAAEQSAANALVARSVRNAGAEFEIFGKSIEQVLEAESRITGIADDELAPAFTRLVQVTKDSAQAFNLLQLAEDVSRQRKIGVALAANSLAKAQGGQISALRRIIPGLKEESKELSKQENIARALAQVREQFGGSRLAFAESDAGALARLNIAADELKESLGTALLPTLSDAARRTADWLSETENQERVQRGITQVVGTTTSVVRGFANALKVVRDVLAPVVDGLGGVQNAVELAFGAALILKLRRATVAMKLFGSAATVAGAQAAAAANAPVAGGRGRFLRGGALVAGSIAATQGSVGGGGFTGAAGNIGTGALIGAGVGGPAGALLGAGAGVAFSGVAAEKAKRNANRAKVDALSPADKAAFIRQLGGENRAIEVLTGPAFGLTFAEANAFVSQFGPSTVAARARRGRFRDADAVSRGGAVDVSTPTTRAPSATTAPRTPRLNADLTAQVQEIKALQTETTADDLVVFGARKDNIEKQISNLERAGLRGKNDQNRLVRLLTELGRVDDEINSIEEEAQQARDDAREERKRINQEKRDQAKQDRIDALQEAKDEKERGRNLREARLQLRLQKAELSGSTAQQKSALRDTVKFYDEQAKSFRKTGAKLKAVEAESNKVSTQQRLKDLKESKNASTAGGARTDFFQEAANQFRTFGSNIGRAGDPLSGQQARGQFAGLALDRGRNTSNLQGDQLRESQSQTDLLRQIRDRLRVDTRAAEGNQPPNRRPPNATDIARVNARNNLAGR